MRECSRAEQYKLTVYRCTLKASGATAQSLCGHLRRVFLYEHSSSIASCDMVDLYTSVRRRLDEPRPVCCEWERFRPFRTLWRLAQSLLALNAADGRRKFYVGMAVLVLDGAEYAPGRLLELMYHEELEVPWPIDPQDLSSDSDYATGGSSYSEQEQEEVVMMDVT